MYLLQKNRKQNKN